MNERIQQLMSEKNLTLSSLASEAGINPTTLSHILNGREVEGKGKVNQKPSVDVITRILLTYKDINSDWLLMGYGPMHKDPKAAALPAALDLFSERATEQATPPAPPEYRQESPVESDEKETKTPLTQASMPELSLSENIDKIVIFFKNKTYVTLKPEE